MTTPLNVKVERMFNLCPYFSELCGQSMQGNFEPRGRCYTSSPEQERQPCPNELILNLINPRNTPTSPSVAVRIYRLNMEDRER